MAVSLRFNERSPSRTLGGTRDAPTVSTHWRARGYTTEVQVYQASMISTPLVFNHPLGATLYRQLPQINEVGHQIWDVDVAYERRNIEKGNWTFNCSISGGTLRIKQSKALIQKKATAGATAPGTLTEPFRIGQNGDTVEGTDIVIPTARYTFTFQHPEGEVTLAYTLAITDFVGAVNGSAWGSFPAGTALFIGGDFSDGSEQPASASYSILYSKNVTGQTIRDMTGIDKKGHEFLDITYEPAEEGGEGIQQPRFVHIHSIYEEEDFADFMPFTPG